MLLLYGRKNPWLKRWHYLHAPPHTHTHNSLRQKMLQVVTLPHPSTYMVPLMPKPLKQTFRNFDWTIHLSLFKLFIYIPVTFLIYGSEGGLQWTSKLILIGKTIKYKD